MSQSDKCSRSELVSKIKEILDSKCTDPAVELVRLGEAMASVGKALKGQTPNDARAILRAVMALEGIRE